MGQMRKILAVTCLVVMASAVGVVPVKAEEEGGVVETETAAAVAMTEADDVETGTLGENLSWSLTKDGVLTISGEGPMPEGEHGYYFGVSYSIKEVIIEEGVTTISDSAFAAQDTMERVMIPSSVTRIGNSAFYHCISLEEIVIPEGVTEIEDFTFNGCYRLEKVIIPESVRVIGLRAFANCGLKEIRIPAGIMIIDEGAFSNTILERFSVDSGNKAYTSVEGVLFTKDMSTLVRYPSGNLRKSYKIPNGVKRIAATAFSNCGDIETLVIPKGVIKIGEYAFGYSGFKSIYFEGNAPEFEWDDNYSFEWRNHFDRMNADIYYPENNTTWTEEICSRDYGGELTWKTWEPVLTGEGDTNGDGKVTMTDLLMCLHHVSGRTVLTGNAFFEADVNGDGKVTMVDLMRILHYVSGRNKEL